MGLSPHRTTWKPSCGESYQIRLIAWKSGEVWRGGRPLQEILLSNCLGGFGSISPFRDAKMRWSHVLVCSPRSSERFWDALVQGSALAGRRLTNRKFSAKL